LFVLGLLLPGASPKLIAVWNGDTDWSLRATCAGADATPCPVGMACGAQGECVAATTDKPTCIDCSYSGGAKVDALLAQVPEWYTPVHLVLLSVVGSPEHQAVLGRQL
jgi:hypothetical protein